MKLLSSLLGALVLALSLLASSRALAGVDTHRLLLVVNDASPTSRAIGRYYQSVRHLPDINVCHLTHCPADEIVSAEVWHDDIKIPIWNYLNDPSHPWLRDQIEVFVLTKGVPFRLTADANRDTSVDMALCYLGNSSAAGSEPIGRLVEHNRYFAQDQSFAVFRPSNANRETTEFPHLYSLAVTGAGAALAAGEGGVIVRKDGASWSPVPDRQRAFPGTAIVGLAGADDRVWAVQMTYLPWDDGGRIMRSTDGGASWSVVKDRGSHMWMAAGGLAFADADTGWVVGAVGRRPAILTTSTGGGPGQWEQVDPDSLPVSEGMLTGVAAPAPDRVIACGTFGIVLTGVKRDGIWKWQRIADIPAVAYRSVAMVGSVGWIVGGDERMPKAILKTTDGGESWRPQYSPAVRQLMEVYAFDATHAWVTTGTSTLLRTDDDGREWKAITLPSGQDLQSVRFTTASDGLAVGGKSIFATTDGGSTWRPVFVGEDTVWRVNYLVTRLDGYQTPADANGVPLDVKRTIDDASRSDHAGRFVLDQGSPGDGEGWAAAAAETLTKMKAEGASGIEEVMLDAAPDYRTDEKRVMGYCSWGSNDGHSRANTQWAQPRNQWRKGSLSSTYVSTSARTMSYPPDYLRCRATLEESDPKLADRMQVQGCWSGWYGVLHDADTGTDQKAVAVNGTIDLLLPHSLTNASIRIYYPDGSEVTTARIDAGPDRPIEPTRVYRIDQSPFLQSLIADLIREGCSASIGHVTEPYLEACGQPQYLFPRYVSGFPWAEASYMSMAWGAWREVAVGDPLLAAYATPPKVTLTAPRADGTVISGRTCTVSATALPDHAPGISRVEFWLTDGKGIDALLGAAATAPYQVTFDTALLPAPYNGPIPNGRYVIEAVAYEDTNVREVGRGARAIIIKRGGRE